MTPHTLEEQKALLTAEAEGRAVKYANDGTAKVLGVWHFKSFRYEVERPLMERWLVLDAEDDEWDSFAIEADAIADCADAARRKPDAAPFRVVHLREVR